MKALANKTVCKDGTMLSIQASRYHYCTPRVDDGDPYTKVEVGFITGPNGETVTPPETWRPYADGSEFPNSVYGYVPVELVEEFVTSHGGQA